MIITAARGAGRGIGGLVGNTMWVTRQEQVAGGLEGDIET